MVEPGGQAAQSDVNRHLVPVIDNGTERRLALDGASSALRMADIQSSMVRLRPNPMLPNEANTTRMAIRRHKRVMTWIDFASRVKFTFGS
jgi:hypothetical protein